MKDLNAIRNAFVDVLMSMYHTREIKPIGSDKTEEAEIAQKSVELPRPPRAKP